MAAAGCNPPFILLLGPPAAGKGTQAPRLARWLGIPHVATGDMFREAIRQGTEAGRKAKEVQARGELISDDLVYEVVSERLAMSDCAAGAILDGFPRNRAQAEWLDSQLEARRAGLAAGAGAAASPARRLAGVQAGAQLGTIYIELPFDEVVRRLSGRRMCPGCQASFNVELAPPRAPGICDHCGKSLVQRPDDNPESIRTRRHVYEAETAPLVEFYGSGGRLVTVSGLGPIDEITREIQSSFDSAATGADALGGAG